MLDTIKKPGLWFAFVLLVLGGLTQKGVIPDSGRWHAISDAISTILGTFASVFLPAAIVSRGKNSIPPVMT